MITKKREGDGCEFFERMNDLSKAIECYKKRLVEAKKYGDFHNACKLLGKIGSLYKNRRNFNVAEEFLSEAIRCAEQIGDSELLSYQYVKLGNLYQELERFNKALYFYVEAEELFSSIERNDYSVRKLKLSIMNNKAVIFMLQGNITESVNHLKKIIEIFSEHEDFKINEVKKYYVPALVNLGSIHFEIGEYGKAESYLSEARNIVDKIPNMDMKLKVSVYLNLAYLLTLLKKTDKAKKLLQDVKFILPTEDKLLKIHYLLDLSKLWREMGEDEVSIQLLEKAKLLGKEINHAYAEGLVYNELGLIYKDKDDLQKSLEYLTKARKFFETSDFYKHKIRSRIEEIENNFIRIAIQWGSKVEDKDPYTLGHSARTTYYAFQIGKIIYQGDELALKGLIIGGFLHDIGKLKISDRILRKAGRLTQEEYQEIRKHPVYAVQQLKNIEFPWGNVKECILYHHEKFDGSGYPEGLYGDDIPMCARIISVADVFDALTTERPYRAPWSWEKALDYIVSQKNLAFDPYVVDVFVEAIKKLDKRLISTQYTEHMVRELWKFFA